MYAVHAESWSLCICSCNLVSSDVLYFPFRLADCPPQSAALPIELSEVVCSHDSIYIAGVYRFFLPFLHINEGGKTLNYT